MSPIKLARYALSGWLPGGNRYCPICGHWVHRFMPYRDGARSVAPLMVALGAVGSDVENFECPRCGCHDRERHLLMYLQASGLLADLSARTVVHFAPEKHLGRIIGRLSPGSYIRADLHPSRPDVQRMDLLDTGLATASVDLLIANHVLEHVSDDVRALQEIVRVLRPGGAAVLQTPYSEVLERTWSDSGITAPVQRLQAYGQEDHVRLYGCDIFERFASTGLSPRIGKHDELLAALDPVKYGVNVREPFFLFVRE